MTTTYDAPNQTFDTLNHVIDRPQYPDDSLWDFDSPCWLRLGPIGHYIWCSLRRQTTTNSGPRDAASLAREVDLPTSVVAHHLGTLEGLRLTSVTANEKWIAFERPASSVLTDVLERGISHDWRSEVQHLERRRPSSRERRTTTITTRRVIQVHSDE